MDTAGNSEDIFSLRGLSETINDEIDTLADKDLNVTIENFDLTPDQHKYNLDFVQSMIFLANTINSKPTIQASEVESILGIKPKDDESNITAEFQQQVIKSNDCTISTSALKLTVFSAKNLLDKCLECMFTYLKNCISAAIEEQNYEYRKSAFEEVISAVIEYITNLNDENVESFGVLCCVGFIKNIIDEILSESCKLYTTRANEHRSRIIIELCKTKIICERTISFLLEKLNSFSKSLLYIQNVVDEITYSKNMADSTCDIEACFYLIYISLEVLQEFKKLISNEQNENNSESEPTEPNVSIMENNTPLTNLWKYSWRTTDESMSSTAAILNKSIQETKANLIDTVISWEDSLNEIISNLMKEHNLPLLIIYLSQCLKIVENMKSIVSN